MVAEYVPVLPPPSPPPEGLEVAASTVSALTPAAFAENVSCAETALPEASFDERSGICLRHAANRGVLNAHAGSWTRRSR